MTTDATPTCAKLNAARTAQSRLLIQIVNAWISPAQDGRTNKKEHKGKEKEKLGGINVQTPCRGRLES